MYSMRIYELKRVTMNKNPFQTSPCQESNLQGICMPGTDDPIPCGRPGHTAVFHKKDRRVYIMCDACSYHNIKNRGGIELVPAEFEVSHEFIYTRAGKKRAEMHAMRYPPAHTPMDRWVKCYLIGNRIHLGETIG